MEDKKFKPHVMYSKSGDEEMANTPADHERLSKTDTNLHSPASFAMGGSTFYGRGNQSPMTFKGANSSNSKCWPGHAPKAGEPKTKMSETRPGIRVNNCS